MMNAFNYFNCNWISNHREKLYAEIERAYNEALDKQKQEAAEKVQNGNDRSKQPKTYENEFIQMDSSPTPFR